MWKQTEPKRKKKTVYMSENTLRQQRFEQCKYGVTVWEIEIIRATGRVNLNLPNQNTDEYI